jgi:hypothetical protein
MQLAAMANLMVKFQNPDGSVPSWLTKELKVVPILDRSAQSALPIWFLAEYAKAENRFANRDRFFAAAKRGADFLAKEVVDQQRYYDFETFFSCSPKVCLQRNYTLDDDKMIDPHTLQRPQNTLCMQWSAEALRSVANQGYDSARLMKSALKALDIMSLYQNVWPISYRKVAYTYGGFGVQDSDGEYNDARQAQFGETLCDFGVQLNRPDLFERGVAAGRASLTLINHPQHIALGLYPNPNYPLGLEPENNGHGGSDQQNGRTGFDWGEGSGLATYALLLDKYGSSHTVGGRRVAIDGVERGKVVEPKSRPILTDPIWDFKGWTLPGWSFDGNFLNWAFPSRRMNFANQSLPFIGTCEDGRGGFDDTYIGTITSPKFKTTHRTIKLLVGGGSLPGTYVELLDGTGKRIYVERGHDREAMDERVWDVSAYVGQELQIRIVDRETGGWGHINVGNIRVSD